MRRRAAGSVPRQAKRVSARKSTRPGRDAAATSMARQLGPSPIRRRGGGRASRGIRRDLPLGAGLLALLAASMAGGCVTERIEVAPGLGSFQVQLVSVAPYERPEGCADAPNRGSRACPRPFAEAAEPVRLTFRARALDRSGALMPDFSGSAMVDVRPGVLANVGPSGLRIQFQQGQAEAEVAIAQAYGDVRLWVEDCGSPGAPGSFATGVSQPLHFDFPRLTELNRTADNTTSPMRPRTDNICALGGDNRYGIGVDYDGEAAFVGPSYKSGEKVDAPPPAIGNYVRIEGCTRARHNQLRQQGEHCARGPLVVTGIDNSGFYVTDINPRAQLTGFNHVYAFNFNYPDNLQVGDVLTRLQGGPVEFAGTTQISNPNWVRDGASPTSESLVPEPFHITPAIYSESIYDFGRNARDVMNLEINEGALVCVDNIAPAAVLRNCDSNGDGRMNRRVCRISRDRPLPSLCREAPGRTSRLLRCEEDWIAANYCFSLSEKAFSSCGLQFEDDSGTLRSAGRIPYSGEYCCERLCYSDPACTEEAAYLEFGQWTGEMKGRYALDSGETALKLAFVTRDADPSFDPFAFAQAQLDKPPEARETLRIVGNLRHVLAARPVWVVVARRPSDIEPGASCP